MAHLDRPMYLLGYLAGSSRVYLIDKEFGIVSYTLLLSLIEYKTLVMRGEEEEAANILPTIPKASLSIVPLSDNRASRCCRTSSACQQSTRRQACSLQGRKSKYTSVADTCRGSMCSPCFPQDQLNNVAKFLEARGLPDQALSVATDPDYRFELAVKTNSFLHRYN